MSERIPIRVDSEIGRLEAVILHAPGQEIENMTPATAERALYSDILSRGVSLRQHDQMRGVLERVTRTFEVRTLLEETLADEEVRTKLVRRICRNEGAPDVYEDLLGLEPAELTRQLVEGVVETKDTLTKFLNGERYALRPLHNFFFMRDASMSLGDRVVIGRMANRVRERESLIMDTIFRKHPLFAAETLNPFNGPPELKLEGGDLLVAREDVLLVGIGARSSARAVDWLVDRLIERHERFDVVVQELPEKPESFIHLDMIFTLLDRDVCMVYEPVIIKPTRLQTVHIHVEGGRVASIREEEHIPDVLRKLGMELETVTCGGHTDPWIQEREQWHSGTNFFALAPGRVMGYGRNVHTVEELDKHGFRVIHADDVLSGAEDLSGEERCVVTIDGEELARGGGGCRCMTMPIRRAAVE